MCLSLSKGARVALSLRGRHLSLSKGAPEPSKGAVLSLSKGAILSLSKG